MNEILKGLHFQYIYFRGERFDQPTIEVAIDHLAKYLRKNIQSSSPFIVFTACNHIKTVVAYYAIQKAGKIAVILDPQCKLIEYEEIIKDVDPCAIILLNEKVILFDYQSEIIFSIQDKSKLINNDLTDVCLISYTNAEDGFSKGAMLTGKNLLSEVKGIIKANGITRDSIVCALVPFSHLYGFTHGLLVLTQGGGSGLITQLNFLKMVNMLDELEMYKVTHFHTVPSTYYFMCKVPGIENSLKSMKKFCSGGIHLPSFIYDNFFLKTKRGIRQGYGLTEGSAAVAGNYQDEAPVTGSFGKAFPNCELKIIDEENHECANDIIGEICVKGDMVFKGYLNHEDTTKNVLVDGWLHTGDYGKRDQAGFFYFCGLKKNMINVSGNKVYPKKLERMIGIHSNVLKVKVNSELSILQGHTVGVNIRLKDTSKKAQEELKKWCKDHINNSILPKTYLFD